MKFKLFLESKQVEFQTPTIKQNKGFGEELTLGEGGQRWIEKFMETMQAIEAFHQLSL